MRRVHGRRAHQALRQTSQIATVPPLKVFQIEVDGESQLAMAVPRRCGNAVRRNRLRRVLRDEARRVIPAEGVALLVSIRPPTGEESDLRKALQRAMEELSR